MLQSSSDDSVSGSMAPDEQQFLKALGARIAQLRKDQGISQQAMADGLGIAQQTYAHYESGPHPYAGVTAAGDRADLRRHHR